ncbi:hypothetical protein H0A36_28200 [Endozoicomonas sp. SM1973]|uniref:Uncharacterized protein n=1 Tax=Spartinivicinus marinus TaxID=2994442 RepID=A0A853I7L3_9GAMM|nr:hypothetical protein [Spartinivicinus marinus]MCX4030289.1 hypothetical protein [Spartinivicinus marinus]NYZ69900.1 hypothetical protein [Spartinivicinus marinus]
MLPNLSIRLDQLSQQGVSKDYLVAFFLGYLEGYLESYRSTHINTLLLILEDRFGKLPGWVDEKILNVNSATLRRWILNVHKVDKLESVFQL